MCKAGGPRCEDKRKNRAPDNAAILAAPGVPKPPAAVAVKERPAPSGLGQAIRETKASEERDRVDRLAARGHLEPGYYPTRDEADRWAAKLPANRADAFGERLDDKGRRLFALREAGYQGPLDGDCYPSDPNDPHVEILRDMQRRRGETPDY